MANCAYFKHNNKNLNMTTSKNEQNIQSTAPPQPTQEGVLDIYFFREGDKIGIRFALFIKYFYY
ncbi:hypothetical protein DLD14_10225 [Legionella anisa]|nr:hypothetical protein DLD14_10225 [Legionella anisa]